MALFGGGGFLRYFVLGFGALLVGMQMGYTIHYTSMTPPDAHREAYEYMMALHDMQDEGLISEADLKYLVAKHREELGGIGSSGGTAGGHGGIPGTPKLRAEAAGTKNRKPVVQVEVEKKIKSAKAHQANGLCDGGNPKEKKLVFIKTHKTGSSTITNILHRVIQNYGYSPAVPTGNLYYAWPSMNEGQIVSSVDPRISPPYNIAGSGHSRYNRKAYDRIMGPNTHYITVLRDPRSHIYSSFNYWSVPTHIQLNKGPAGLTPEEFIVDVPKYWPFLRQGDVDLLHNNMCYDLGGCENGRASYRSYSPINFKAAGMSVDEWIEQMDNEFSLILITDFMDESLVLLKQLMCWETKDIIYLGLKMKSKPRKGATGSRPERVQPTYKITQEQVQAFSPIDTALYKHFNRSLWAKIEAQGDSFYEELHEYQSAMWDFSKRCKGVLGSNDYSDDTIRYYLEDDPTTPEADKACWEAVLDSGGFVKHLKREFGVHPSRTECIAQARNRHILQVRQDHPLDNELYKAMMQGIVEFKSAVDVTSTDSMQSKRNDGENLLVLARCSPSFYSGSAGSFFHLAANYRINPQNIKSVNYQLGLKRVTVMRDPVTEFLHAWVNLGVGNKLYNTVMSTLQTKSRPMDPFFTSDSFKMNTAGSGIPLNLFVDNAVKFLPFIDEALGRSEGLPPPSEEPFGECARVLFNRQLCKMHGQAIQSKGNYYPDGANRPRVADWFDAILVGKDLGGSLVLMRRWLCWPIELVSMISATAWKQGMRKPDIELMPGYTPALDDKIRTLNKMEQQVYDSAASQITYHRQHSVGFQSEANELELKIKMNEARCADNPSNFEKSYPKEVDGVDRIAPDVQCEIMKLKPRPGDRDLQPVALDYFGVKSIDTCKPRNIKPNN